MQRFMKKEIVLSVDVGVSSLAEDKKLFAQGPQMLHLAFWCM